MNENIKLKSNQKNLKEEFEDDEIINKLLQKRIKENQKILWEIFNNIE